MKNNPTKKDIEMLLKESGKNLAQVAANASFDLWSRKDFRLYVDFENSTQTEQDRIFNELEVSVIGLFVLHMDQVIRIVDKENQVLFKNLQNDIIASFLNLFTELDIETKFINQWEMLINMRLREYRDDYKIALKEYEKAKDMEEDSDLHPVFAAIETIGIDCLTHIRRGNIEKDDPLWKLLRKWFITLDAPLTALTSVEKKELKN